MISSIWRENVILYGRKKGKKETKTKNKGTESRRVECPHINGQRKDTGENNCPSGDGARTLQHRHCGTRHSVRLVLQTKANWKKAAAATLFAGVDGVTRNSEKQVWVLP